MTTGNRPLRILRIADVPDNRFGGMSRVMYLTSDPMMAKGHHVELIFRGDLPSRCPNKLRRFSVPFQIVRRVLSLMRAGQDYDVIEIHEPLAAVYCLARRIYRRLPAVVVLSHSLESRTRLCFIDYRKRRGVRISAKSRYSHLAVVCQANYALRRGDGIVCSTIEDRNYLLGKLKVPADRVRLVNWGVLPQYFAGTRTLRSGILFHGTWIERKGILDLVPAASSLLAKYPDLRVTLSGVGFPATVVAESFPASVRGRLKIIDSRISEEDLIELYLSHSIFVCPSYSEGQLLTMLEAAAAGCAIVTTDVCGMKDFIRHGVSGLLSEPGDSDALGRNLERLVTDPIEARRLGDAAREHARSYTWEQAADKLLAAYESARDRRRESGKE